MRLNPLGLGFRVDRLLDLIEKVCLQVGDGQTNRVFFLRRARKAGDAKQAQAASVVSTIGILEGTCYMTGCLEVSFGFVFFG